MTLDELIEYYQGLLILQYNCKEKALRTIETIVKASSYELIPAKLYEEFDLDSAIGVQLDAIGKYAGVLRKGKTFTRVIELNDDDYRELIRMAIAKNYMQSTLYEIDTLLQQFFPDQILAFDYQNMSMSYLFDAEIGSEELAEMFIVNNLLPKPLGVQLGALIYSNNIDAFFGFRTYPINTANNAPFNSYDDYSTDTPWLSYDDAITI